MKLIELLNLMSEDKHVPYRIKFNNIEYTYDKYAKLYKDIETFTLSDNNYVDNIDVLNSDIEVLVDYINKKEIDDKIKELMALLED